MSDMSDEEQQSRKGWEVSGVFVPAGLFIGMGFGFLFDNLVAGLFIGLGVGLLAMVLVRVVFGR